MSGVTLGCNASSFKKGELEGCPKSTNHLHRGVLSTDQQVVHAHIAYERLDLNISGCSCIPRKSIEERTQGRAYNT